MLPQSKQRLAFHIVHVLLLALLATSAWGLSEDFRQTYELAADGRISLENIKTSLRQTDAQEHLRGSISKRTAHTYYWDLVTVLSRNSIKTADLVAAFKSSVFLDEGKALSQGMTQATEDWRRALVSTPGQTSKPLLR